MSLVSIIKKFLSLILSPKSAFKYSFALNTSSHVSNLPILQPIHPILQPIHPILQPIHPILQPIHPILQSILLSNHPIIQSSNPPHQLRTKNLKLKTKTKTKTSKLLTLFLLLLSVPSFAQDGRDTSSSFVESVKDYSQKNTVLSRILRSVLVFEDDDIEVEEQGGSYRTFYPYRNRHIRSVDIRVLDVFGPSIRRPARQSRSWLQKSGNALHITTREWLISQRLLFKKGERLNPAVLAESERMLRESKYIYDARIIPVSLPDNPDSIDVRVVVQDVWSITGGIDYRSASTGGLVRLRDINFLGLGGELVGAAIFHPNQEKSFYWEGAYNISNLGRRNFNAGIFHYSENIRRLYGFSFGRDFYTPVIKYAGGLGVEWEDKFDKVDDRRFRSVYSLNRQDVWLGYAFDIRKFNIYAINQNRLNVALRIVKTRYTARPDIDSIDIYDNNIFYLGRLGYAYRGFIRDKYIFALGRTEDIAVGSIAEFLTGVRKGKANDRNYYGVRTAAAAYSRYGYIYAGLQAGGFPEKNRFRSSIVTADMLYFTRLLPALGMRWRHYIRGRFRVLYDPYHEVEEMSIRNLNGIRGFTGDEFGSRLLALNYENNIFLPLNFLGFSMALITFADLALISGEGERLITRRLLQGYGLGIRFRNEHLVFPTVQLMIGFYTHTRNFSFFTQRDVYYYTNTFQFSKPQIISPH